MTLALSLLLACDSSESPPPDDAYEESSCEPPAPAVVPLRRLSQREMAASSEALTGVPGEVWSRVPDDALVLGFDNSAYRGNVSLLEADAYLRSAEDLAAALDLRAVLPCTPAGATDEACATAFIETFGRRVYRRALDPEEVATLLGLWHVGADAEDFDSGAELVVQAMFQSPEFLYRVRAGDGTDRATDLAFFLWGSTPDEALQGDAEAGALDDLAGVTAAAERLVADPRARDAFARFVELWMGTSQLASVARDDPWWTAENGAVLLEETRRFSATIAFDEAGTLGDLLTRDGTVGNATLAGLYGVPGPSSDDTWAWLPLDPAERSGLLSQGSVLAYAAHENQTSPVHRGQLVREKLLCQTLPPPPGELNISLPSVDPDLTTRERFARHSQDPSCAGCHLLMDPIGFGFERYDAIGRWRETEGNDLAVESTGFVVSGGFSAPFDGVPELSALLAANPAVAACLGTQLFRYARGREESAEESCAFAATGADALETPVATLFLETAVQAAVMP